MGSCQSTTNSAATPANEKIHKKRTTMIDESDKTTKSSDENSATTFASSNPKSFSTHHSSSVGLETLVEKRRTEGHLVSNVVNIEGTRAIESVYDGVHNGKKLGEGVAGLVRLVTHKATGVPYAVKCLDLQRITTAGAEDGSKEQQLDALRNEITIMSQLDHPNIARLQEVYEDDTQIYLVQELGQGGELFDVLDEQPDYHYSEPEAVKLIQQMLSALRYLHSKDIIHRDLKLENWLFSTKLHKQLKMIGKPTSLQEQRANEKQERLLT